MESIGIAKFDKIMRVVHCDWGRDDRKRSVCVADRTKDGFRIDVPRLAGRTDTFFERHREGIKDQAIVLFGFDFPIGLPHAYAKVANVKNFLDALPLFGTGVWKDFFKKANEPNEVSIHRPFYPRNCKVKGAKKMAHLATGLRISKDEMFRSCEKATNSRNEACRLFWTLGANQVGTAAMLGWEYLLQPFMEKHRKSVGFWPFDGGLGELCAESDGKQNIIVETYPGEMYSHLNFPTGWTGKRQQPKRMKCAQCILDRASSSSIIFSDKLKAYIDDGFGPSNDAEDDFDAVVGLCSMLQVVLGQRSQGLELSPACRATEGWIFGQTDFPK